MDKELDHCKINLRAYANRVEEMLRRAQLLRHTMSGQWMIAGTLQMNREVDFGSALHHEDVTSLVELKVLHEDDDASSMAIMEFDMDESSRFVKSVDDTEFIGYMVRSVSFGNFFV